VTLNCIESPIKFQSADEPVEVYLMYVCFWLFVDYHMVLLYHISDLTVNLLPLAAIMHAKLVLQLPVIQGIMGCEYDMLCDGGNKCIFWAFSCIMDINICSVSFPTGSRIGKSEVVRRMQEVAHNTVKCALMGKLGVKGWNMVKPAPGVVSLVILN